MRGVSNPIFNRSIFYAALSVNQSHLRQQALTLAVSSTFPTASDIDFVGSRRSVATEIDDVILRGSIVASGVCLPLGNSGIA